jgi:mucin-19
MAKITTSNLNNTLNSRITAGETALAAVANVVSLAITSVQIANSSYAVLDDTAANTSGTTYLVVNGSGFTSDCIVIVGNTNASSTTFANSKQLRAAVAAQNAASYPVYVTDIATGATATKINGLTFSSFPVWGTATALANVLSNTVFSTLLSANSDSSVTYSNTTILPTGTALLSNGYFYGNISIGESSATYSFDVKATDAELQDQTRTFSLTTVGLPPTYGVDILVLGGGGGASFGGGGAGGMLFGPITVNRNTPYTITVGGGGNGTNDFPGPSPSNTGPLNGSPSQAFGYTAFGGGFGAHAGNPVTGRGGDGASGGGGWRMFPSPFAAQPGGTGSQGYPGGSGASNPPIGTAAGGGGGAGGTGSNGTVGPTGSIGGNGGPGATWPIDGRSYAAGGGGIFNGGPGGSVNGTTPPTSSGGQGNGGQAPGSPGAPGLVSIAIPSSNYPGSAPPAASTSTPPAAPGKIIVTFTSSGTFTA